MNYFAKSTALRQNEINFLTPLNSSFTLIEKSLAFQHGNQHIIDTDGALSIPIIDNYATW